MNGQKKILALIIGLLWSVVLAVSGFAWGSRSSHILIERHLEKGHPITVETIDRWLKLEVRLTRMESLLEELKNERQE